MNLAAWAQRNGVARVTAYGWFRAGLLAVPAQRVGRLILVTDAPAETGARGRTAVYARVSSADQKADLDRQVARVQDIGWDEHWQCDVCSARHQRDDNAAVNLARYEETVSVVGPVGAAVKRGADRKTRPGRAGGCEAQKGRSRKAAEQPRDGVQVA